MNDHYAAILNDEYEYLNTLKEVMVFGEETEDRTGVGTISKFGIQTEYDLKQGFPLFTTKKMNFQNISAELLWFIEGSTDERRLAELTHLKHRSELEDKTTIWTANANKQGKDLGYENSEIRKELGPVYGWQWRSFDRHYMLGDESDTQGVDQLAWVINEIKTNPSSRRIILSAWNPKQLHQMALPPCHVMAIFSVKNKKLSCMLIQRSADMFLGVPYNVASYSLLTHLLARECGLDVGKFVHSIADAHIYKNHIDAVVQVTSRAPFRLPKLVIDDSFDLSRGMQKGFTFEDVKSIRVENYEHHPFISAPMAV